MKNARSLDSLPKDGGAYAIVIRTEHDIVSPTGSVENLPSGLYLYLGSAYGPGGLRARVRRHARPKTGRHWHVDHLTEAGKVIAVAAFPGGEECRLVDHVREGPDVSVPAPGFGSSDCRTCEAHLLALPRGAALEQIFDGQRGVFLDGNNIRVKTDS